MNMTQTLVCGLHYTCHLSVDLSAELTSEITMGWIYSFVTYKSTIEIGSDYPLDGNELPIKLSMVSKIFLLYGL